MQKIIRSDSLHSQTVQGVIQSFYEALRSWDALRKTSFDARPPRRLNRYYAIPFKSSAIMLKDGVLTLSTGKNGEPIKIPWKFTRPKVCEISFSRGEYILNAVYAQNTPKENNGSGCAGVDLGEVHLAAVNTGARTIIFNGRELRSKRRYQDKLKAHFRSKMGKCTKRSRKWKRFNNAAARSMRKIDNQIKDILHKQTTAVVCAVKADMVQTVGIGYVSDSRNTARNTPAGKVKQLIIYKAKRAGMDIELINERDTSQICPKCGLRNKPENRNYECAQCGLSYHRDGVGAINIRSRTLYREITPVVGEMTPPVGIRYYADTSRTSAHSAHRSAGIA